MKKNILFYILLLMIFNLSCNEIFLISKSCDKEYSIDTLSIGDLKNSYKVYANNNNESKASSKNTGIYSLYINDNDFTQITKALSDKLKIKVDKKNVFALTLFHNKIENDQLQINNIKGYQIYYEKGKNLITEVYENIDNQMVLINDLTSNVLRLSSSDAYSCSKIFTFSDSDVNVIMLIDQYNVPKFQGKNADFSRNLYNYLNKASRNNKLN